MRRALAIAAAVALACGCSGDSSDSPNGDVTTVAFLRAVAGGASTVPAFVDELRRAGFRDGLNLALLAENEDEAYPGDEEAAQAVRQWRDGGADLIVALSTTGARIARTEAPDVNVLFLSNDPLAAGLVTDESSPTGRLTGVTFRVPADRTLALAARAVPGLTRIGLPYPPDDPAAIANRDAVQAAADELGITVVTAEFGDAADVAAAIDQLAADGVQSILLSTSPVATRALAETAAAAAAHRLPVIANSPIVDFAVVSLSPDTLELGRQLGRQATRLLSGAEPSIVPVENPNRFVLTLNARAASELRLVLADDLLREADLVIE